jgi:hypothetical protein
MLIITAIALDPATLLFLTFSAYASSGVIFTINHWYRRRKESPNN